MLRKQSDLTRHFVSGVEMTSTQIAEDLGKFEVSVQVRLRYSTCYTSVPVSCKEERSGVEMGKGRVVSLVGLFLLPPSSDSDSQSPLPSLLLRRLLEHNLAEYEDGIDFPCAPSPHRPSEA